MSRSLMRLRGWSIVARACYGSVAWLPVKAREALIVFAMTLVMSDVVAG